MIRFGKTEKEFQELYSSYAGSIQRLLKGMTGNDAVSDELTQEAFTKAWVALPQFGFKSALKTWIYQVAINVGRDWLRSHKNRSLLTNHIDEIYEGNSENKEVQEALMEMSDEMRELLILFYWEGIEIQEIAVVLSIPVGTVKSRLHTGRNRLKEILLLRGYDV